MPLKVTLRDRALKLILSNTKVKTMARWQNKSRSQA
jgi:hypothetical protein